MLHHHRGLCENEWVCTLDIVPVPGSRAWCKEFQDSLAMTILKPTFLAFRVTHLPKKTHYPVVVVSIHLSYINEAGHIVGLERPLILE
jgi:hypothetical protein